MSAATSLGDAARRRRVAGGRQGRPRDPALDTAIQAAVFEVLAEVGYAGLTMDAVAQRAGVGKATIYRRWATKADLLVGLIDAASDETLVVPDSGALREDLVLLLEALVRVLGGSGGSASRALIGVVNCEPALAAAYRQGPLARWAEGFMTVLQRAVARGEIAPAAVPSLGAEAGPSILLQRWMVSGMTVDEGLAAAVVDEVMLPLLRATDGGPAS